MPRKKGDKTHKKFDERDLKAIEKLAAVGMSVEVIARQMGMSETTFESWRKEFPEIDRALKKGRDDAHIQAHKSLYKMAFLNESVPMAIFYAKTQLGWKEPKQEIEITTNAPTIQFNLSKGKPTHTKSYIDQPVKTDDEES